MKSGEVTGIVCLFGSVFAFFASFWYGMVLLILGLVLLIFGKRENDIDERLDLRKGGKKK